MKIDNIWLYVAGIVMGVALATIIASWGEATVVYRVVFIALLGLLLLATWSKRQPYNRNNNANDDPPQTVVMKRTDKGNDSAN